MDRGRGINSKQRAPEADTQLANRVRPEELDRRVGSIASLHATRCYTRRRRL